MRASLRRWPVFFIAFLAISVVFLARSDSVLAYTPTWTATGDTTVCAFTGEPNFNTPCTETATDLTAGNPSSFTLTSVFPPGYTGTAPSGADLDYNFSQLVSFLPPGSSIQPDAIPIGAIAGRQHSTVALGATP